jgi:CheY-like chemotaxis protein
VSVIVLVVDEAEAGRQMLAGVLGRAGFEVRAVGSGRQAIRQAAGVDAVVLNTPLPDISGERLCWLLREDPDTAHLPVLLVVGPYGPGERNGQVEGVDGLIVRPFAPSALVAWVHDVLARDPRPH